MSRALPDLIAEQVAELIDAASARAPRAVQRLASAGDRLTSAASPGDYQAVALLCRDALFDYADSVFSPDFADGEPVPTHDQFVSKIRMTLRSLGDKGGSETLKTSTRSTPSILYADLRLVGARAGAHST